MSLYVLDRIPSAGTTALALLKIPPSGKVVEQWRTRAVRHAPQAFLTVTPQNEIVVSISRQGVSEVMVLDTHGLPLRSAYAERALVRGAIGSSVGITMPLDVQSPTRNQSNLELRLVRRYEAKVGVCGARWLRAHALRPLTDPLGGARGVCQCGDADDEGDGED